MRKGGKTEKYKQMNVTYDEKLHSGAQKYRIKLQNDIISGNRSSSYAAMRNLGEWPGEATSNTYTLPGHTKLTYSARESTELIAILNWIDCVYKVYWWKLYDYI